MRPSSTSCHPAGGPHEKFVYDPTLHSPWLRSRLACGAVLAAAAEPARNTTAPATDPFAAPHEARVRTQIEARGIQDAAVLAAMPRVPPPLIDQLKPGARLVVPEGERDQELVVYEKTFWGDLRRTRGIPVRFVPMTGRAQEKTK
jgi:hypothetical protein